MAASRPSAPRREYRAPSSSFSTSSSPAYLQILPLPLLLLVRLSWLLLLFILGEEGGDVILLIWTQRVAPPEPAASSAGRSGAGRLRPIPPGCAPKNLRRGAKVGWGARRGSGQPPSVAGKKPNGVPRPAVCMDSFLCLFYYFIFFFTWVGCEAREGRQCCSVRGKQAGCLRYQHILTRRMNFQRSINNYLRVCLFVRCVDVVPEVSQ